MAVTCNDLCLNGILGMNQNPALLCQKLPTEVGSVSSGGGGDNLKDGRRD